MCTRPTACATWCAGVDSSLRRARHGRLAGAVGALEEQDYRGDFTIERRDADDPAYELQAGVKFLRSL